MEELGLYSQSAINELMEDDDCCIEYAEGTLLDNFIFYNSRLEKYFLCIEHALNTWSSCYKIFSEEGNGSAIFSKWNELMENWTCVA